MEARWHTHLFCVALEADKCCTYSLIAVLNLTRVSFGNFRLQRTELFFRVLMPHLELEESGETHFADVCAMVGNTNEIRPGRAPGDSNNTRLRDASTISILPLSKRKRKPSARAAESSPVRKQRKSQRSEQSARRTSNTALRSSHERTGTCHCHGPQRELAFLRSDLSTIHTEFTQRWDTLRNVLEMHQNEERDRMEKESVKDNEWKACMLKELTLLRTKGFGDREKETQGFNIRKEYVKLVICTEFLRPDSGSNLFGALSDSESEDSKLVREAAVFALGTECTEDDVRNFLGEFLTTRKSKKDVKQRVGAYIATGMNRAQDSIHDKLVEAFLSFREPEMDLLKQITSHKASEDEKIEAAKEIA
ncbi:hypothetical protein FGB62_117g14 [Gracilaria domingensis]|nr:hypothetical protein FGB62_117g14 [Gracilaria domingensis]